MQKLSEETKNLLLPYEGLRARFDIRDFFLRIIVKQIYENTGQTLSLVRLQMSEGFTQESNAGVAASGKLIEQTIKDLRIMGKCFFQTKYYCLIMVFQKYLGLPPAKFFVEGRYRLLWKKKLNWTRQRN